MATCIFRSPLAFRLQCFLETRQRAGRRSISCQKILLYLDRFLVRELQPGETKTVALEITPESLAFYDVNMKYVVEPGEFEIMAGNSSRDADLQKVVLTVTK